MMGRYTMRAVLSVVFAVLIMSLVLCDIFALRSKRPLSKNVATLLVGLTIPVLGNLILIVSTDRILSTIGCYVYFLGMDAAVISLLFFTYAYCDLGKPKKTVKIVIYSIFGLDSLHYILNPFLKLSFTTEKILVDGIPYYRLVPYIGQAYHRVVCYGLFFVSLFIFIVVTVKAAKVYVEKYMVILLSMVITGSIESYYIFSGHPLDMSMIGFGIFGVLL